MVHLLEITGDIVGRADGIEISRQIYYKSLMNVKSP